MNKKSNKEITNIELLASINQSFSNFETRIEGKIEKDVTSLKRDMTDLIKKEVGELRENLKATRHDISAIGDRFVPRYEFDNLLIRFNKPKP